MPIRLVIGEDHYLVREGELLAADLRETRVDQGLYLLLAELASHG